MITVCMYVCIYIYIYIHIYIYIYIYHTHIIIGAVRAARLPAALPGPAEAGRPLV